MKAGTAVGLLLMGSCCLWSCIQRIEAKRTAETCQWRCDQKYFRCTNGNKQPWSCTNAHNECSAECEPPEPGEATP
jgi:hypothetical protein